MNQVKINQIISRFKKYSFNTKYDDKKGFHVTRKAGRDSYVYIKYDKEYNRFGIQFMNNWHHPKELEEYMKRISELITITNEINAILKEN